MPPASGSTEATQEGTFRLFSSQATGLGLHLSEWKFPVVCQLESGKLQYDNFNGRWGDPDQLNKLQRYAAEKAHIEARRKGHTAPSSRLADGSIK